MKIKRTRDPGLVAALTACGKAVHLATQLGITPQAIAGWRRVPAERVIDVERVTGVSREILRPDLYPADERSGVAA
jgi:DNA-binding transcriptional regulator YdaS (Cro superfamily)